MPGAPPRKVEAEPVNSTAIRVTWKAPLSTKQHGQIRGYQVIYSRMENGQPNILDVALPEAQVPAAAKGQEGCSHANTLPVCVSGLGWGGECPHLFVAPPCVNPAFPSHTSSFYH